MQDYQWVAQRKRQQLMIFVLITLGLTVWSAFGTDFSFYEIFTGAGELFSFIFVDLLPPDLTQVGKLGPPLLDTLYMGFVGMVVGAVISLFFAFLAAHTTSPHPAVQAFVRGFASVLRNIPALIWALFLVSAYGLGTMIGTLALIINSVGLLTRAFADALEEIDMGQVEAVRATGAGYLTILFQGVFPQFFPSFVAWSLYNMELNIRASTIIGMVGGGGIGFAIQEGLKLFQFKEVSTAILMVLILIFVTEWVSNKLRERVI